MIKKIKSYFQEFCKEINIEPNVDYRLDGKYIFHSEKLWGIGVDKLESRFSLDKNEVLLTKYNEIGEQYNPAYIAYYGLMNFNRYLDTKNLKYLNKFNYSLNWIKENAIFFEHNNIICKKYVYSFQWINGESILQKGWCSAMAQGLVASILIRGYYYYNDSSLLELAKETINLFKINIEDGGVRANYKNYVYYEEYPSYPLSMVLDGSLFALVGIYELSKIDNNYEKDFWRGVKFIEENFYIWDFYGIWTKYGIFNKTQFLSTNSYNLLNKVLLEFFIEKKVLNVKKIREINKYSMAIINLFKIIKSRI